QRVRFLLPHDARHCGDDVSPVHPFELRCIAKRFKPWPDLLKSSIGISQQFAAKDDGFRLAACDRGRLYGIYVAQCATQLADGLIHFNIWGTHRCSWVVFTTIIPLPPDE